MKLKLRDILFLGGGLTLGTILSEPEYVEPDINSIIKKHYVNNSNLITIPSMDYRDFDTYFYEEVGGDTDMDLRKHYIDRFLRQNKGNVHVFKETILGNGGWRKYERGMKVDYEDFRFVFEEEGVLWVDSNGDQSPGKKEDYRII
jgi:hypothetical protein